MRGSVGYGGMLQISLLFSYLVEIAEDAKFPEFAEFLELAVIRGSLWCSTFGICGLFQEGGLETVEGPPTSRNVYSELLM